MLSRPSDPGRSPHVSMGRRHSLPTAADLHWAQNKHRNHFTDGETEDQQAQPPALGDGVTLIVGGCSGWGAAGGTEDTEGAGLLPPLWGCSLEGSLRCSPGPAGPGPAPGAKMETSPPAKSVSWPAAAGLPKPPPRPPPMNRTLPLGSSGHQGRAGGQPPGDRGGGAAGGHG